MLATCLVKYRPVSPAGSVAPADLLEACAAGIASAADSWTEGAAKESACLVSPPPPAELAAWIDYDRKASRALRPEPAETRPDNRPDNSLVLVEVPVLVPTPAEPEPRRRGFGLR